MRFLVLWGGAVVVCSEGGCGSMCWPVDRPATHAAAGAAARGALIFCFGGLFHTLGSGWHERVRGGGFNPLRGATTGVVMRRRATSGEMARGGLIFLAWRLRPPAPGAKRLHFLSAILPAEERIQRLAVKLQIASPQVLEQSAARKRVGGVQHTERVVLIHAGAHPPADCIPPRRPPKHPAQQFVRQRLEIPGFRHARPVPIWIRQIAASAFRRADGVCGRRNGASPDAVRIAIVNKAQGRPASAQSRGREIVHGRPEDLRALRPIRAGEIAAVPKPPGPQASPALRRSRRRRTVSSPRLRIGPPRRRGRNIRPQGSVRRGRSTPSPRRC